MDDPKETQIHQSIGSIDPLIKHQLKELLKSEARDVGGYLGLPLSEYSTHLHNTNNTTDAIGRVFELMEERGIRVGHLMRALDEIGRGGAPAFNLLGGNSVFMGINRKEYPLATDPRNPTETKSSNSNSNTPEPPPQVHSFADPVPFDPVLLTDPNWPSLLYSDDPNQFNYHRPPSPPPPTEFEKMSNKQLQREFLLRELAKEEPKSLAGVVEKELDLLGDEIVGVPGKIASSVLSVPRRLIAGSVDALTSAPGNAVQLATDVATGAYEGVKSVASMAVSSALHQPSPQDQYYTYKLENAKRKDAEKAAKKKAKALKKEQKKAKKAERKRKREVSPDSPRFQSPNVQMLGPPPSPPDSPETRHFFRTENGNKIRVSRAEFYAPK